MTPAIQDDEVRNLVVLVLVTVDIDGNDDNDDDDGDGDDGDDDKMMIPVTSYILPCSESIQHCSVQHPASSQST